MTKTIVSLLPTSTSSQMTLVYLLETVCLGRALFGNHIHASLAQAPIQSTRALHGTVSSRPFFCSVTPETAASSTITPVTLPIITFPPRFFTSWHRASMNFQGESWARPPCVPMSCWNLEFNHSGVCMSPAPRPTQFTRRNPMLLAPNFSTNSSCKVNECLTRDTIGPRCHPESASVRNPPALPEEWHATAHFSIMVTLRPC
mmetsp:Transcript_4057/g.11390  ORF Transcript_4057/g.11390 Transcript_4057/m.11390 type:complete len:202 (+) Transcript_4057:586-1191(+)